MGDVLSQNEIDNLLSALNSGEFDPDEAGEADDRQIKDYDFARPSKFSKEHLRTLEFILEHYARLLSTNLPVYLRKNLMVTLLWKCQRKLGLLLLTECLEAVESRWRKIANLRK